MVRHWLARSSTDNPRTGTFPQTRPTMWKGYNQQCFSFVSSNLLLLQVTHYVSDHTGQWPQNIHIVQEFVLCTHIIISLTHCNTRHQCKALCDEFVVKVVPAAIILYVVDNHRAQTSAANAGILHNRVRYCLILYKLNNEKAKQEVNYQMLLTLEDETEVNRLSF